MDPGAAWAGERSESLPVLSGEATGEPALPRFLYTAPKILLRNMGVGGAVSRILFLLLRGLYRFRESPNLYE